MLSDIHVDIMDYIKPAYCNEAQFRSMWGEFEWENRVNVTTDIKWVSNTGSNWMLTNRLFQGPATVPLAHYEVNEHGVPYT